MSDASSLILLPPRQTAQPAADSSSSSSTKSTQSDGSFHEKLKAAKKKIAVPAKPLPTPVLVKSTKPVPVKTDPSPAEDPDATESKTGDQATADQNADPKVDVKTPTLPTLPGKTIATQKPKPAKADEEEESSSDAESVEKNKSAETQQPVEPVNQATTTIKKQPGQKPAVKKPGDAAAQPNASAAAGTPAAPTTTASATTGPDVDAADPDPITSVKSAFYGSGKVVPNNTADAADEAASSEDANADTAASANAAPAAEIAVDQADPDVKPTVLGDDSKPQSPIQSNDPAAAGALNATVGVKNALPSVGKMPAAAVQTPQASFAEVNQPKIITSIAGQLMPHGGTMQIRLDPPELGALQVTVHMKDGVMTASFETSSDHATKLLSHSLGQLKAGLEAAGVNVEKLHVQQSTGKDTQSDSKGDSKQTMQDQQQQAKQDQQRREMVQKMWRKLAGGDPLDLVA